MVSDTRLFSLWLLTLWLGLAPLASRAQVDSTATAAEELFTEKLFRDQNPKRMWLRWNLVPLVNRLESQYISGVIAIHLEQKIRQSWSILATYRRVFHLTWGVDPPTHSPATAYIGVSTRYYYQMAGNIEAGRQASNLNGSYLSLQIGTLMNPDDTNRSTWYTDNFALTTSFGTQRQLYSLGFADFGFGIRLAYGEQGTARFIYPIFYNEGWQVFPIAYIRFGLGV